MIREDVWEALASMSLKDGWGGKAELNRASARLGANQAWAIVSKKPQTERDALFAQLDNMRAENDPATSFFARGPVPFSVGLGTMFQLLGKMHQKKPIPQAEIDAFLDTAADMHVIHRVLMMTRYQWRPTYGNGPQFGEWKLHKQVLSAFAKLAKKPEDL